MRIKLSRSSDVGQGGFAWLRGSIWIFQPSASKEYNVNWDSIQVRVWDRSVPKHSFQWVRCISMV